MPDTSQGKTTAIAPAQISASVTPRWGYGGIDAYDPKYQIQGAGPEAWFGPLQPLPPLAPPGTGGRQFDYPFGFNLNYIPRGNSGISFAMLRNLADALPELRLVIEHRKDQICGWGWDIQKARTRRDRARPTPGINDDPRITKVKKILAMPDRRHPFHTWLRMIVEDMLVIDAATIYPRFTRAGELYSLDAIDGSTIKPLIGADGRTPLPEEGPAYQQILHGIPAADFDFNELLYLPRNVRTSTTFGYPPVEQIILTVNTSLRRALFNLEYYQAGSVPDAIIGGPPEWTPEQITKFQRMFDDLMSGNLAERRKLRFVPGDAKLQVLKEPPLKDLFDEWLFKIICYAFSIPASAVVNQVNRATAETLQLQANDEGLLPLKLWIKAALDHVVQNLMGCTDLEFIWSGDESLDILQQAQVADIGVRNGSVSRDEWREQNGYEPWGIGPTVETQIFPLVETYNLALETIKNGAMPGDPPPGDDDGGGGSGKKKPAGQTRPPRSAPSGGSKGAANVQPSISRSPG